VVATGRPALPTITGNYYVQKKYSPYRMVSPWPYGSPYYYPPVWMSWAMEWEMSGYFIHDAPWRTRYGPGANFVAGTHGCINVPHDAMSWLYNWTPVGTTVTVIAGSW
jgi:lipoprotein-anchoring transpeptidase ErfK/SrfK